MAPSKEVVVAGSNAVAKIDPDQTLKASKALLQHIKKAAKQNAEDASKKNVLGEEDDVAETPIWLTLTTKRHISSKSKLQPGKITLPHSLNDENTSVCLITATPQRAYKDIIDGEDFPADLRKRITRVIDLGKLKGKYSQYEAQRKLFSEHDIFLADDRIINRVPKVLGKTFYKTTAKRPVPVILQSKAAKPAKPLTKRFEKNKDKINAGTPEQIAKEIEKALGSALVSLSPTTNTAVRIGFAGWDAEKIADNVDAVAGTLVEKWVPSQWANVRGVYVKGPESAALPIWLTDELWLDEKDVVADDHPEAIKEAERANVGKKRKSIGGDETETKEEETAPKKKKAKKQAPEGDDDKLDKQISERKSKLKKQKAAAKKAMDE